MSRRRWLLWLGPPIAVLAVALVLSRWQAGVVAGGRIKPQPVGVCTRSPVAKDGAGRVRQEVGLGAWWRLTDSIDKAGTLSGRQLAVGRAGMIGLTLDLGVESSASGPVGGVVVVASDTGRKSEIRLVSATASCSWHVDETKDVVRGAILDPTDGSVLAHLVDRATRADLGTWRFGASGAFAKPALVAPALGAVAGGPIWSTELRLDATGMALAVQSCGESACMTRVFDLATGVLTGTVQGDQGTLVGFAGARLLTWAACRNLSCALVAWDPASGARQQLVEGAQAAALSADGHWLAATLDSASGKTLRYDLMTGAQWLIAGVAEGEQVLGPGGAATGGLQVRTDEVAIGALGATPHALRPASAEVIP